MASKNKERKINLKYCYNCKRYKDINLFSKSSRRYDGLQSKCKLCVSQYKKLWNLKNENKNRQYNKIYYINHKQERLLYDRKYRRKNRIKITKRKKRYDREHKKERAKKAKERYQKDPLLRLIRSLRSSMKRIFNKKLRNENAFKYLGCSIKKFKQYIQLKFYRNPKTKKKMTWANYGKKGWHLDHIIPLCSIKNVKDIKQIRKVCHYTNLRPLWAEDNLKKSAEDKKFKHERS